MFLISAIILSFVSLDGPGDGGVNRILEQLEERGRSVRDLSCDVEFTVEDALADDHFTKFGSIMYKHKEPNPIFLIHFAKSHQQGRVVREREWYRFDGTESMGL